jgi:hypothetical protein
MSSILGLCSGLYSKSFLRSPNASELRAVALRPAALFTNRLYTSNEFVECDRGGPKSKSYKIVPSVQISCSSTMNENPCNACGDAKNMEACRNVMGSGASRVAEPKSITLMNLVSRLIIMLASLVNHNYVSNRGARILGYA